MTASATAGQLVLFDVELTESLPAPISSEVGLQLLRLLNLGGWRIHRMTAFGGGVLLEAYHRHWPLPTQVAGATLAVASLRLVETCNEAVPPT